MRQCENNQGVCLDSEVVSRLSRGLEMRKHEGILLSAFLLQCRTITGQCSDRPNLEDITIQVYRLLCDSAHRWWRVQRTVVNRYTCELIMRLVSGRVFQL